ncbi:MAG: hypothetical protein U0746_03840 [Gemmataceae bacterium]
MQRFFATGAERFYVTGDMFDPTAERFIRITTTGAAESDGPLPAKVEVFETATGKRLWSAELGVVLSRDTTRAQFDGTGSRVRVEYRTEKGHYLRVAAAADGSHAKTLQLGTAEFHRIPNGPIVPDFRNHTQIQAVAPNSRYAAVLKAGGMDLWDLDSGERLHHLIGFEGNAIEAVFNPDGTRLFCHVGRGASATAQHRLHIWDMATGRELLTLATMVGNNVGRIQFEGDRIHLRASKYRILDGRPVKD